jgi:hypothetical protein
MNNSITFGPIGMMGPIGLTGPVGQPGPVGLTNIEYRKLLRIKKIENTLDDIKGLLVKILENGNNK